MTTPAATSAIRAGSLLTFKPSREHYLMLRLVVSVTDREIVIFAQEEDGWFERHSSHWVVKDLLETHAYVLVTR